MNPQEQDTDASRNTRKWRCFKVIMLGARHYQPSLTSFGLTYCMLGIQIQCTISKLQHCSEGTSHIMRADTVSSSRITLYSIFCQLSPQDRLPSHSCKGFCCAIHRWIFPTHFSFPSNLRSPKTKALGYQYPFLLCDTFRTHMCQSPFVSCSKTSKCLPKFGLMT